MILSIMIYRIRKGVYIVNRDEFCKYHWEYYLVLEKDFLETERYISFDLGDNYLYDEKMKTTNIGNSMTFSNEYIKQYQNIYSGNRYLFIEKYMQ